MKRYLLCPGWITSQNDGDRHYIGARKLAQLYGVSIHECITARIETGMDANYTGLIQLHPRSDGNYDRPKA